MTPDLQRVLGRYIECGWIDARRAGNVVSRKDRLRPAYLHLSSDGMQIHPCSELQVTVRCGLVFRAHKMVVAEDSGRFLLTDLKIGLRSQFTRAQNIPLREHVALVCGIRQEVQPDPIRWPLEVCTGAGEVSVCAIIPDGCEADPGVEFEVVLLGEVVF